MMGTQQGSSPDQFSLHDNDIIMTVLPFYHIFGMVVTLLLPIYFGCTVILLARFDPQKFLECVEKYRVNLIFYQRDKVTFCIYSEKYVQGI